MSIILIKYLINSVQVLYSPVLLHLNPLLPCKIGKVDIFHSVTQNGKKLRFDVLNNYPNLHS